MTRQPDFWEPRRYYDFAAVVAGVDINKLAIAYVNRAGSHVRTVIRKRHDWNTLERHHDMYDRAYFERSGLPQAADVWDNRRRVGAK